MRERGLQVTTINRRLSTLRSLVKLANTHGLVTWTLSVESVPAPPYRDMGELGRGGFHTLLKAAGAQPGAKGLRDVALLRLLHDLGLRRSEAVRLDTDAVDLTGNRILIPGRGRSPKQPVSLPEPTRAALAAWLEARGPEPGPLFVNFDRAGKGQRLTGAAVYHIVGWLGARPGSRSARTGCAISRSPPRSSGATAMCARWRNSPAIRTCAPSAATATTDQTSPARSPALSPCCTDRPVGVGSWAV